MSESLAAALDLLLLDAVAGSEVRPAGLRNGIAGLPPTAGGEQAMMGDLAALAAAVAPVGGSQIAFVAAPGEAAKIALRSTGAPSLPMLASCGLAAGTVVAVALNALVVATDPVPRFSMTKQAAYHAEDTIPLPISTPGAPATVAAPARSLYQTDCVALRMIIEISWALRAPGSLAWIENVSW
jgi:hypothetical protein